MVSDSLEEDEEEEAEDDKTFRLSDNEDDNNEDEQEPEREVDILPGDDKDADEDNECFLRPCFSFEYGHVS